MKSFLITLQSILSTHQLTPWRVVSPSPFPAQEHLSTGMSTHADAIEKKIIPAPCSCGSCCSCHSSPLVVLVVYHRFYLTCT